MSMALPEPPDIPIPRLNDKGYMKVWHKYMQASSDNYRLERERDAWRRAFYVVCAILASICLVMLVLLGSRIMNFYF